MDLKNNMKSPLLTKDSASNLLIFVGRNKNLRVPLLILDVINGNERAEAPDHLIN